MVKTGHQGILQLYYENKGRPRSELELLRLSDILKRSTPLLEVPHRMEFHLLAVYVSGRTRHTIDFEPFPCRRGTVVLVRPGQVHQWNAKKGVDAILCVFTPSFLFVERPRVGALWHERYFDDLAWPSAMQLEGDHQAAVLAWLALLGRLYAQVDEGPSGAALMRHVLSALLLDLARRTGLGTGPPPVPAADLQRLRRFKLDVERSFRVTRSVGDYAQRLGCSVKTIDRACRASSGRSAKATIDARVALEARRLLAHTALSVSAVADDLGFTEATNFIKFFKARTGQLPGAFRGTQR